ncbi:hypothetical protein B4U79_19195, partial [Dinothrombium tinctorium]
NESVEVDMMINPCLNCFMSCGQVNGKMFRIISLPFMCQIQFNIIFPIGSATINQILDGLVLNHPSFIEREFLKLNPVRIHLIIPKFEISTIIELKELFTKINFNSHLFDEQCYDYSKLCFQNMINLVDLKHIAMFKMTTKTNDQEHASTSAIVSQDSKNNDLVKIPSFIINRPFIFLIYDPVKTLTLFVGKVQKL